MSTDANRDGHATGRATDSATDRLARVRHGRDRAPRSATGHATDRATGNADAAAAARAIASTIARAHVNANRPAPATSQLSPPPPGSLVRTAWTKWRALARRAAELQSHVLMWLLYWIAFVPLAFVQRWTAGDPLEPSRSATEVDAGAPAAPQWRERPPLDADLPGARRQY